jgi:Domain of Unknown Function (DUF1206)
VASDYSLHSVRRRRRWGGSNPGRQTITLGLMDKPFEAADAAAQDKRRRTVEQALVVERSGAFRLLVRAGFVARALTYGVIGGVAAALALGAGASSGEGNQQGALTLIAHAPLGRVVVGAAAVGLLMYAVWKLTLAIVGRGPEGARATKLSDRISNLAGAVVYFGFCAIAVRVLSGTAGNQSAKERHTAAGVLGWPGGPVLVGIAGVVMIAVSAYQINSALRGDFAQENKTEQMSARERRTFLVLGRVGLTARAVVFVLAGYFLVRTAIDFKPSKGIGLDGTLAELHSQPYGAFLLAVVAAGLLIFAGFSLLEARYRRL